MAEPDYRAPSWPRLTTGPGPQSSELSAPLLSAHAPFQQQIPPFYGTSYMPVDGSAMRPVQDISLVPMSNQLQGHSPYPPDGSRHQHYQHHVFPYHFPGPRPPPAFWNGPDQMHPDVGFYDGSDRMLSHQPFIPPRIPNHNHQVVHVQANPGPPQYARRRYDHRMTLGSIARNAPGEGARSLPAGNHDSPAGSRVQNPRPPQVESGQPSGQVRNVPERRSWTPYEAQGPRSERSISPQTSNRRNFARYSVDLSHSSTSSDAEEAAARAPPLNRMRHRPRQMPPRFLGHRPLFDPNIATPRQIQELKDKLPRRLPSELSEDASKACDICQKDYAVTHVVPTEEEEIAIVLSCGHSFGEFCISQWFDTCKTHKNKVTCPMCRKQLIEPSRFHHTLMQGFPRGGQAFADLLAAEGLLANANELRGDFSHV